MYKQLIIIIAATAAFITTAKASEQDSTSGKGRTEVFGFVDAYYAYNFNLLATGRIIPYAYNHSRHNEFNVNMALIGIKYESEKEHAVISLHAGTYAIMNYASEPLILQHIYEGYAGIKLGKKIWLDAGIFSSHIGIESAISKDSWTVTRSLATEGIPYFESGVRAVWTINDSWTASLFGLNGWQNIIDNNANKAVGTQVTYKPSDTLLINSSTYIGEGYNAPVDDPQNIRYFHDLYAIWQPGKIGVGGVFDIGLQELGPADMASWWSTAVLLKYDINKKVSLCGRGEYFHDPNGVIFTTGALQGFQVAGASLNIDYKPSKHTALRLEAKQYVSEGDIYIKQRKPVPGSTTITASLEAWF